MISSKTRRLIFLDRDGVAVKLVCDVPPWRVAAAARAHSVVELPAGACAATPWRYLKV